MSPLAFQAFDILVAELERHGNLLSEMHRAALLELLDTLAEYVEGKASGRRAFALPSGMGKTSAIAAFIAALDKSDSPAAVAVAASKVEALCNLKRDLIRLGVRPDHIGLKHSLEDASEPSTGSDSFPYQLITHARVRSGRDLELVGCHEGRPRALIIYDETLFRSEVLALDVLTIQSALGALAPFVSHLAPGAKLALAFGYLTDCCESIRDRLDDVRKAGDSAGRGLEVELPCREPDELESFVKSVRGSRIPLPLADTLESLLRITSEPLRVLATSKNSGVLWTAEAVPGDLRNVVILDASQPIRKLALMDPTVEQMQSFTVDMMKTFGAVKIVQIVAGGSRTAIEQSAVVAGKERSALSQEITALVRESWEKAKGILIFTFKKRGMDIEGQLRRDLKSAGFDPSATTAEGHPRIQILTWGQETSLNGYEYCDVVIMAGVLHRSYLDIAAEIRGQKGHLSAPTPNGLIRAIVESEVAHLIYQGASRGSCRRVSDGKAMPMTLYFVHRDLGMRRWLEQVMPGAVWEQREPIFLKSSCGSGVVLNLAGRLLDHLRSLPEDVQKTSSKEVKAALGIPNDEATKKAFTRAFAEVAQDENCGWVTEGRSLRRRDYEYYFGKDPE